MIRAVADTHAIIWYLFNDSRLSQTARTLFENTAAGGDQIGISAITLAEIVYLSEKGRIKPDTIDRVLSFIDKGDTVLAEVPVDIAVVQAMRSIPWKEIPDLPDRIIAASALSLNIPVISRDQKIQLSAIETIW